MSALRPERERAAVAPGRTAKERPQLRQRREDVRATCRVLYRRGWMPGTSGNVSVSDGEHVVISASGRPKGSMTVQDTVAVGLADGVPLQGETQRPSAETSIHLAIYRAVRTCAAVIHVHSPYATCLSAGHDPAAPPRDVVFDHWELAKGLGVREHDRVRLPVFPNWPDVARIALQVAQHLEQADGRTPPALLLSRHGVTAWGSDLQEAQNRLECVEALSQLVLLTGRGSAIEMENVGESA